MKNTFDFFRESRTFASLVFSGGYDMYLDDAEKLFNHYIETGENLLDAYSRKKYLLWQYWKPDDIMVESMEVSPDEYVRIRSDLYKLKNILCIDISNERCELNRQLSNYYERHNDEYKTIRSEACRFTSDKKTIKFISDKFGMKCLKCGSTENITIDHIIPVKLGGENTFDNIQPLCASCNSSKGTKIKDYR